MFYYDKNCEIRLQAAGREYDDVLFAWTKKDYREQKKGMVHNK